MNDTAQIVEEIARRRAGGDQSLALLVESFRANPGRRAELYNLLDEWGTLGNSALDKYSDDVLLQLRALAAWGAQYVHLQAMDRALADIESKEGGAPV